MFSKRPLLTKYVIDPTGLVMHSLHSYVLTCYVSILSSLFGIGSLIQSKEEGELAHV